MSPPEDPEDRRPPPPPRENPELVGQEAAEAAFLEAHASGRLAHAWLITGPKGIGKATLAYRMARFMLSAVGDGGAPGLFGDMPTGRDGLYLSPDDGVFRRVASGGHADFMSVERGVHEKTKRPLSEIVVGQVRGIGRFLSLTPAEGAWRVVVVDAADEMNPNAANALLKVLEEPPARAILLLVSHNPGRLLPTIRSRCRHLAARPLTEGTVVDFLARHRPELAPTEAATIARLSEGSLGRALVFADGDGLALHTETEALLAALPELDLARLHKLGDKLARADGRDAFTTVQALLGAWLAGRLRAQAAGGAGALEPWIQVWENIGQLTKRADSANLDRKQLILNTFSALQAAAQVAASRRAVPHIG